MGLLDDLKYVFDMTERMPEDPAKFDRWLGFIQGVIWAYKLRTVDEMREDNRISSQNGLKQAKEAIRKALTT